MNRKELSETMNQMDESLLSEILLEVAGREDGETLSRTDLEAAVSALYTDEALETLTAEDFLEGFSI